MKLRGAAFAVLAALCCAAAGAADKPAPVDIWLRADITIDGGGRITALEWTEAEPSLKLLAGRITSNVQAWEFVPAMVSGLPKETRTALTVKVRVNMQDDGSMSLQVTDARTGPKTLGVTPPAYPPLGYRSNMSARVVVELEVQPDGRAEALGMKFDSSSGTTAYRGVFLQATEEALRSWAFRPEFVANHAVKTRMEVLVEFCLEGNPWCAKQKSLKQTTNTPANMPIALDSAVAFKTDFRAAAIP